MIVEADNPPRDRTELTPQPDRSRTKIAYVREQLHNNPKVYFAGEIHRYHPGAPEYSYWTETVDIIISPTTPQFEANQLNSFMDSLIVGMEPTSRDTARGGGTHDLNLGRLYFDETIGSLREVTLTTIETSEPDVLQRAGRIVGESKREKQRKIQRRTWVRVYPDPTSAQAVYEYENGVTAGTTEPSSTYEYADHWLTPEQVDKLRKQYTHEGIIDKAKRFLPKGK
jgi:hypothetical protein